MASPTIAVRVKPEIYERIQKRAAKQGKTITALVQELLEGAVSSEKKTGVVTPGATDKKLLEAIKELSEGLAGQSASETIRLEKLEEMETRLKGLLVKAVKAAAASQFYARAGALEAVDLVSIWSAQIGQPGLTEVRKEVEGRLDADSHEFADWWLKSG